MACTPNNDKKSQSEIISGNTMGTYYRVTLSSGLKGSVEGENQTLRISLQQDIESRLQEINQAMSTYDDNSEISHFNRLEKNDCQVIGDDFDKVLNLSTKIYQQSEGYFNPMVGPLVERWGFGRELKDFSFPSDEEISKLLSVSDYLNLFHGQIDQEYCKANPASSLNLSAVAKGYGVDAIADLLEEKSYINYLVDIGGELRAGGLNPKGEKWHLAIEKPVNQLQTIQKTIYVSGRGIATSGDYRNFFEWKGQRYSHTIDPNTGFPVEHNLASVTVLAETAANADAWATALLAAGPDRAKQMSQKYDLAVYLITRKHDKQEEFSEWHSTGFNEFLSSKSSSNSGEE